MRQIATRLDPGYQHVYFDEHHTFLIECNVPVITNEQTSIYQANERPAGPVVSKSDCQLSIRQARVLALPRTNPCRPAGVMDIGRKNLLSRRIVCIL